MRVTSIQIGHCARKFHKIIFKQRFAILDSEREYNMLEFGLFAVVGFSDDLGSSNLPSNFIHSPILVRVTSRLTWNEISHEPHNG